MSFPCCPRTITYPCFITMVPGKQAGDSSNQSFFPGQWNFNNQNKFLRQKKIQSTKPLYLFSLSFKTHGLWLEPTLYDKIDIFFMIRVCQWVRFCIFSYRNMHEFHFLYMWKTVILEIVHLKMIVLAVMKESVVVHYLDYTWITK